MTHFARKKNVEKKTTSTVNLSEKNAVINNHKLPSQITPRSLVPHGINHFLFFIPQQRCHQDKGFSQLLHKTIKRKNLLLEPGPYIKLIQ